MTPQTELSPREQGILEVARREARPELVSEFEPITHGPLVAIAGIVILGMVAVLYIVFTKTKQIIYAKHS